MRVKVRVRVRVRVRFRVRVRVSDMVLKKSQNSLNITLVLI